MNAENFIHLRIHSEYSLVDSVIRLDDLFDRLIAAQTPAVALTDQSNLFAAVKFYKAALKAGIKPILGVDLWLMNPAKPLEPWRFTLLCQNAQGYRHLTELVSRSYTEGQRQGIPQVDAAWLTISNCEGLIVLLNYQSDLSLALSSSNPLAATQALQRWTHLFPQRLYLELSRTAKAAETLYENQVIALAQHHHIPLVATNDVRFLDSEDFEAHEARVAIHDSVVLDDPRRLRRYTDRQYLRSSDEMHTLFHDLPEALANTVEIAKRCSVLWELGKTCLPNYPTGALSTEAYLTQLSEQGLTKRLAFLTQQSSVARIKDIPDAIYWQRLATELTVINQMGFAGYFLIVADFIDWSKNNGIPVGPGRGSGAGSLVAYALGITDLDPLQYDLLFERFLNPERVSMPDFDVDFCMDGRDRVIDYVADKYGRTAVSQIITYGSMAAKAVIRDVGRVLAHPYGFVDKIAKLIPFEIGITLEKALEQEAELQRRYDEEADVKGLLDLAMKLEGLVRNAGKHAGGVVIAPSKLTDFMPLYCEADGSNLVSQFDKDDVEAVGLVKFDFLGLRTLTIIDWAIKNINQRRDLEQLAPLDISLILLDDVKTFEQLKLAATTAVFQLESRGMKDLIKRLKPDCFEDIVALVALFRPGPLQSGMVDDFIQRKHGIAEIVYPHPDLETILSPTYGVILYQEQVMQIAQVLASFTLGAADMLRRAMGKKDAGEMAKQRQLFTDGAVARGVDGPLATSIFDLMEKFAGYGFNKSHSAAYALLSYQTAWLKTHYPAEFMAAVLSSDMDNTDKVVGFIEECQAMQLTVLAPDVNSGQFKFTVSYDKLDAPEIRYGLGAIKGAGEAALTGIIEERAKGPYLDLFDFCARTDLRKVNKRVSEGLIKSGSFDGFGINRASLMASLPQACLQAEQLSQRALLGQGDLFGVSDSHKAPDYTLEAEWSFSQLLSFEKETLGWYLSGHPLSAYGSEISHLANAHISQLSPSDKTVSIAGQLTSLKLLTTKRGDRMAIATLDEAGAKIDCVIFSEELDKCRGVLQKDAIILADGIVENDSFSGGIRLTAKRVQSLTQARELFCQALVIVIEPDTLKLCLTEEFKQLLLQTPGNCPVQFCYRRDGSMINCALGPRWQVKPSDELLNQLRQIFSLEKIYMKY